MTELSDSEMLFYTGIALMSAAVVLTVVAIIALRGAYKRLEARLEAEFGKRRK